MGLREVKGLGLSGVASGQQREVCPGGPGIQVTIPPARTLEADAGERLCGISRVLGAQSPPNTLRVFVLASDPT